jgi:hypothetical protein
LISIRSTPHTGGSDPNEPNHTSTYYVDKDDDRLVYDEGTGKDRKVISVTHVYENEELWKKHTYRKETASEKEARLAREKIFAEKKAALKAEKQKKKGF